MSDRDDVAAAVLGGEAGDGGADALEEIEEALSARRALLRWRKPQRVRADFPLGIERLALEALPVAQVLLGQIGHCDGRYGGVALGSRRQDRHRGLPRAGEIAGEPHRVLRQLTRQHGENLAVRAVAIEIALAVDAAAIGNGSMADTPPACLVCRQRSYSMVTTILPMALRAANRAMASFAQGSAKRSDTTGLIAPSA